jgi:predicted GH43/DUF377 family glycosyl hydrolase
MRKAKRNEKRVRLLLATLGAVLLVGCRPVPEQPAEARPPGASLVKCGVVLPVGAPADWDGGMVESPTVWFDSTAERYGMVYTGYDLRYPERRGYTSVGGPRIGLAWSDDLLHWEKDPRSPILTANDAPGSPDEAGVTGPLVWLEDGTYHLFYFGTTEAGYEGGRKTLNLATSTDLVSWTRYPGNPVIEPAGDGWRRDAIWHPNIVKVDGTYYLFFNASGVVDGHAEEFIGYATSPDLRTWTVDDEHSPLLVGSREPGAWDATGRAGDPSLYRVGDTWYMAYYSWDRTNSQDGLAMTSAEDFPLGWTPYPGNPVLRLGAPGSFDGLHAGKPFVFRTDDRHHHFYTAVDTAETRQIALAVEPGPCR